MKYICLLSSIAMLPVTLLSQSADTATRVTFGAFVDGYYGYDFGRPSSIDRGFTTQAARHNEFNVNLAFVEARLQAPRVRARLALQAGTSVQSNYSTEYNVGSVSGSLLARHIQEAVVGVQLAPEVWVDGGIFFSHIGMEGFISSDNLTYTRSLAAEFTPYYVSGVKVTWQPNEKLTLLTTVVNGWQNISENNQEKGVGMRADYNLSNRYSISYYNFFGNEVSSSRLRMINGIGAKISPTDRVTFVANVDHGVQEQAVGDKNDVWYAGALVTSVRMSNSISLNARAEMYNDKDQVIVSTGTSNGFRTTGLSLGMDTKLNSFSLWRTEIRGLRSKDSVFASRTSTSGLSSRNGLIVTSLAVRF